MKMIKNKKSFYIWITIT